MVCKRSVDVMFSALLRHFAYPRCERYPFHAVAGLDALREISSTIWTVPVDLEECLRVSGYLGFGSGT